MKEAFESDKQRFKDCQGSERSLLVFLRTSCLRTFVVCINIVENSSFASLCAFKRLDMHFFDI